MARQRTTVVLRGTTVRHLSERSYDRSALDGWSASLVLTDIQERLCLDAAAFSAKERQLPAGWTVPIKYADGEKLLYCGKFNPDLTPVKLPPFNGVEFMHLVGARGHLFRGCVVDAVVNIGAYSYTPATIIRPRLGVTASLRAIRIVRSTHPDIEELLSA